MFSLDGIIKPTKSKVTPRIVWPNKQSGDRVEEQLMFVPPNYQYDDAPLKTILLYNEHIKWKVKDGQSEFVSNCPVNRCTITTNKLDAPYVDAIIFRDQYVKPVHKKPDKQVRSNDSYIKYNIIMKINHFKNLSCRPI